MVGFKMRYINMYRTMKGIIATGVKTVEVHHFVGSGSDFYFHDWHTNRLLFNYWEGTMHFFERLLLLILALMVFIPATEGAWDCYAFDPWASIKQADLADSLIEPIEELNCWGLQNDWLTEAFAIKSTSGVHNLSVRLESAQLQNKISARVVGFGNSRSGDFVPDALFSVGDFSQDNPLNKYFGNWYSICNFPSIAISPALPVIIWLTIDTRGVEPGEYQSRVIISEVGKPDRSLPVKVQVSNYGLPLENVEQCFLWQWIPGTPATAVWVNEFLDCGVNTFHLQHEIAYEQGGDFFLFFASQDAFSRKMPITAEISTSVKTQTQAILERVQKMGLHRDQWAIYITDEPKDEDMDTVIAYAQLIRSVDPTIPFYVTVPWDDGKKITAKGIKKLIDADLIDIWQPYWYHAWVGYGVWELLKQTGKPIWIYEIIANGPRNPNCGMSFYRLGHWYAFNYGVQGLGIYAAYSFEGDPWNDLDEKNDYYMHYAYGEKGFLSTRAFEAFRQGVQDYKLFSALQQVGVPESWINEQIASGIETKTAKELKMIRLEMAKRLAYELCLQHKSSN